MSQGIRWRAGVARKVADHVVGALSDVCKRVQVVGSLRRRRREVGDVEILIIPKWGATQTGLFDDGAANDNFGTNLAHDRLTEIARRGILEPCHPRDVNSPDPQWPKKGDKRRWNLRYQPEGWRPLPVEVYVVTAETWAVQQMIRTGPKGFSRSFVSRWPEISGGQVQDLKLTYPGGAHHPVATEEDIFEILGMPYVAPEDRDKQCNWPPVESWRR